MSSFDWIILGAVFALIVLTLVWVYRQRHRLFHHAQFTAATTYRYFQTEEKQQSMDAMLYQ
ncbi:MAG: hypothetical protein C4524_15275 [Candidatus Zixiibacteriota bacterium]|nr:MAG: hypothetical protein C4524_15275 [candidate division Zixibacteria bacterium]